MIKRGELKVRCFAGSRGVERVLWTSINSISYDAEDSWKNRKESRGTSDADDALSTVKTAFLLTRVLPAIRVLIPLGAPGAALCLSWESEWESEPSR